MHIYSFPPAVLVLALAFSDGFNRSNGDLGNDWWHFGYWENEYPVISANEVAGRGAAYHAANFSNGAVLRTGTTTSSYAVQATLRIINNQGPATGIILRASNSAHYPGSTMPYAGGPNAIYVSLTPTAWEVSQRRTASDTGYNNRTVIASGTGAFADGKTLRTEVDGNQLVIKYDGVTITGSPVNISGYGSGAQVGINAGGDLPRVDTFWVGGLTEYPALVKQQIIKVGRFSFNSTSAVPVTGWTSDGAFPATIVSDSILDVAGSGGVVTVHALLYMGRGTSGTPSSRLNVKGSVVDTFDVNPINTAFGNTDSLRGRPTYLQWTGSLDAGDDILIEALRSPTSATGYVNDGSIVWVEPGNTTYTMQRMYKNTSTFSVPNSRSTVTRWTVDAKYPGAAVSSNQLSTTLSGVGTARAYVVGTSGSTGINCYLMMDGVDIGSVTIPSGDQSGYWITVPGVNFTGSNLLKLEVNRTNSSFTRSLENNSCTVEAFMNYPSTGTRKSMNKSGDASINQGGTAGRTKVTGWASDATYPATVVNDELVVGSTGEGVIEMFHQTGGGSFRQVELAINDTVVMSTPQNPPAGVLTWKGNLTSGDRIAMYIYNTASAANATVTASGTYFKLTN